MNTHTVSIHKDPNVAKHLFYFLDKDVDVPVEMATNNIVSYVNHTFTLHRLLDRGNIY